MFPKYDNCKHQFIFEYFRYIFWLPHLGVFFQLNVCAPPYIMSRLPKNRPPEKCPNINRDRKPHTGFVTFSMSKRRQERKETEKNPEKHPTENSRQGIFSAFYDPKPNPDPNDNINRHSH